MGCQPCWKDHPAQITGMGARLLGRAGEPEDSGYSSILCGGGSVAQSCELSDPLDRSPQAPLSVGFSSKNTGVGCHSLLQGIFPTQGIESGSPALQVDSLPTESPDDRL